MDKTAIEVFRAKLQNILDSTGDDTPWDKGIRAVVKALKSDYDILFPEEVFEQGNHVALQKLMELYCNPDKQRCPICSGPVRKRISRAGNHFLGCQQYPTCKGSRSTDGSPTVNDAMRAFLAKKISQEKLEWQKKSSNRFRNLDL